MVAEKQLERDPVEAAFLAKIAAWTAALDSYRAARALDGAAAELPSLGVGRQMELPVGVFRDKGVKEAIPIYLEAVRMKQTNKEIANGLRKGGIATTSEHFEATVGTALLRLKEEGIVLRFPDGWDLAASYPESLRNRLEKDTNSSKKRGKSRGKAARKTQKRKAEARDRKSPEVVKNASDSGQPVGLEQRIVAYLQTRGQEFTAEQELVAQLRIENVQVLRMTLGKLVKRERIERNPDGRVRLTKRAA